MQLYVVSLTGTIKRKLAVLALSLALVGLIFGTYRFLGQDFIAVVTGDSKLRPIYSVDIGEKKLAISFDACWGAEHTEGILATLKKYNVKTTFFLVNIWIKDYPELVKKIVQAGHEIGLHSTTHPDFAKLTESQMKRELTDNYEAIESISGFKPILFRPPFGSYNNTMIEVAEQMGIHCIQWDVDSLDWKDLSAGEIQKRIMDRVKPGSIVLMHNNGKHTLEALPNLLEALQGQGYQIVPISELIYLENYYVDHQGVQKKVNLPKVPPTDK
ncbi:MAG: polysaccharide deacetylase family protein [Bacillota bacterium]